MLRVAYCFCCLNQSINKFLDGAKRTAVIGVWKFLVSIPITSAIASDIHDAVVPMTANFNADTRTLVDFKAMQLRHCLFDCCFKFHARRLSTHPHKTSSEIVTKQSHDFVMTKNRQSGNVK